MSKFDKRVPLRAYSLKVDTRYRSYETFLSLLRGQIRAQGFTQKEIASELGMDDSNFSMFLNGLTNIDSRRLFVLLCLLSVERLPDWNYDTLPVDCPSLF